MPELHDYQIKAADFLFDRLSQPTHMSGGGLLADLGVGKTAASLTAIERLIRASVIRRVLVLAPKRVVKETWPDEIALWSPNLTYQSIHGYRYDLSRLPRKHIEFQSSDSVHKLVDDAGRWDLVVVDESHNFKEWTRRRMRSLRKILKKTPRRMILTGTPTLTSLADLHSQIYILDDGAALGKNVTVFRAQYMERGGFKNRQWMFKKHKEQELLEKINHLVMRIDDSVLGMPELIEHNVHITMPAEIENDYRTLKRKLYLELENDSLLVGSAAALYTKLKQYACGQVYVPTGETRRTRSGKTVQLTRSEVVHDAKVQALSECIDSLCGKPAIILYQFVHDRERIVKVVGAKRSRVLDSGTSESEASKLFKDWNDRKFDFLISHSRCLCEGLNLQKGGADMIWFATPDKPVEYFQSRGRLYRQGQKESVRMHRLVMRGTVEELQVDRLDGRIKTQEEFLDALKEFARGACSG